MFSGLTVRILKGASANGYGQLVTVTTQLVGVPLFLSFWGQNLYGEWLILSAIPIYLSMGDFGFGAAAATEMTMAVARGEKKAALITFQSTLAMTAVLTVVFTILLMLLGSQFPFRDWFQLRELNNSEISQVVIALGLHVLLGLQLSMLEAGFRCDGNYAKGTASTATLRLLEAIGLFATVLWGGGVVAGALALVAIRLAGTIVLLLALKQVSPWLKYDVRHADIACIKKMVSPAISFLAFPLGNALSLQGMNLLIGAVLGPSSVVVFSVTRTISRVALQAMGLINSAVWPELSMAFGQGRLDIARRLHRLSCRASFWLVIAVIAMLIMLGETIINVWTDGQVAYDAPLFQLMLGLIFANSFWYTSSVVHAALNKHQRIATMYLIGAGVSLLLAMSLLSKFGLNGAVISLIAIDCLLVMYVVPRSIDLTQDDWGSFYKYVLFCKK